MEKTLIKAFTTIIQSKDKEEKFAALTTKGMCLNCGREATARMTPSAHTESPALVPTLLSTSLPGPNVMRGGFKLPVREQPGSAMQQAFANSLMDDSAVLNQDNSMDLSFDGANRMPRGGLLGICFGNKTIITFSNFQ